MQYQHCKNAQVKSMKLVLLFYINLLGYADSVTHICVWCLEIVKNCLRFIWNKTFEMLEVHHDVVLEKKWH